jgi:hypothetical protein
VYVLTISEQKNRDAADQTVVATPVTGNPQPAAIAVAESTEEAEVLQASIKAGSVAQIVVAVIAVIGLIYLL